MRSSHQPREDTISRCCTIHGVRHFVCRTLRRNLSIPMSAKIRLLDSRAETVEFVKRLEKAGACALTVHMRYVSRLPDDEMGGDGMREAHKKLLQGFLAKDWAEMFRDRTPRRYPPSPALGPGFTNRALARRRPAYASVFRVRFNASRGPARSTMGSFCCDCYLAPVPSQHAVIAWTSPLDTFHRYPFSGKFLQRSMDLSLCGLAAASRRYNSRVATAVGISSSHRKGTYHRKSDSC